MGGKRKIQEDIQLYSEEGIKMDKDEAEKEIERFWGESIYKMHENKIEVWGEEERRKYSDELNREPQEINRAGLREHLDMVRRTGNRIKAMEEPKIDEKKVKMCLKKQRI